MAYHGLGQEDQALFYVDSTFRMSQNLGHVDLIRDIASYAYLIYKETGDFKQSLKMHELKVQMTDSLTDKKLQEDLAKQEARFQFEKAQLIKE